MLSVCGSRRKLWPDGIAELDASGRDYEELTTMIGKAFAGTQSTDPEWSMNWVLGPQMADVADPTRAQTCKFFMFY